MTSSMTIKQRLTMFVALICGIQLIVAAFVFVKLVATEEHVNEVAHRDIPMMSALSSMMEHQLEQRILYNRAYRFAIEARTDAQALKGYQETRSSFDEMAKKVVADLRGFEQLLASAESEASGELQGTLASAKEKHIQISSQYSLWSKHANELFSALEAGDFRLAETLDIKIGLEGIETSQQVDRLLKTIESFTEEAVAGIEKEAKVLEVVVIGAAVLAAVIAVTLSRIILNRIYQGLNKVSASLATQAAGDFSQVGVIDEPGIIGELQRNMEGTRKSTNAMLAKVASEVGEAVQTLNSAAQAVKGNSDAQSGEIMQVATAVNEMSATAQEIANNASQTQAATESASQQSSQSMRINGESMRQTNALIESLNQSSVALTELEKNSGNITSVLDVIKGIAEQTNLLALNAAIEAARAGEQGRGFAVVADEVRSLAQRTHDSTSEIETMIAQLSSVTKEAVETMQKSCEMGDETLSLSKQSSELLSHASEATTQVTDMNLLVASAAEEQSGVVEEINKNVNKISEMAAQSASEVEVLLSATDRLNQIARDLAKSVGAASAA
ncbi:methyl-accepting chemotaxis protein [Enterovibrio sp. 27052020O]|uniref:methyl-accepting chemotaxis protein n=1 Tax=Enterovibrio sp. 27052020O TaxID=3241166 RepID=UPI00388E11A6